MDTIHVPHVIVEHPIGETIISRCHADIFDAAGTLTITSVDEPDAPCKRTFAPGTWRVATVFDVDGYPLYWFYASEGGEKHS